MLLRDVWGGSVFWSYSGFIEMMLVYLSAHNTVGQGTKTLHGGYYLETLSQFTLHLRHSKTESKLSEYKRSGIP